MLEKKIVGLVTTRVVLYYALAAIKDQKEKKNRDANIADIPQRKYLTT